MDITSPKTDQILPMDTPVTFTAEGLIYVGQDGDIWPPDYATWSSNVRGATINPVNSDIDGQPMPNEDLMPYRTSTSITISSSSFPPDTTVPVQIKVFRNSDSSDSTFGTYQFAKTPSDATIDSIGDLKIYFSDVTQDAKLGHIYANGRNQIAVSVTYTPRHHDDVINPPQDVIAWLHNNTVLIHYNSEIPLSDGPRGR